MAEASEQVSFKKYGVKPECSGCGRKLVKQHEPAIWFTSRPCHAVYGYCCWSLAGRKTA